MNRGALAGKRILGSISARSILGLIARRRFSLIVKNVYAQGPKLAKHESLFVDSPVILLYFKEAKSLVPTNEQRRLPFALSMLDSTGSRNPSALNILLQSRRKIPDRSRLTGVVFHGTRGMKPCAPCASRRNKFPVLF